MASAWGLPWVLVCLLAHAMACVVVPVSKTISWRLVARHEQMKIADWHDTGLAAGALPSNAGGLLPATDIDRGPSDYHATVIGIFFQYAL